MSTPPDEPLVPPSAAPHGGNPAAGPRYAPPGHDPAFGQPPMPPAYPAPYPPAYPYAEPAWPAQPAASAPGWGTPEGRALQEAQAALRKARTALGWAIGASVGALLALLAAFAVPAALNASEPVYADAGYPVWGEVVGFTSGDPLSGSASSFAVEEALREDGADVDGVDCPDTDEAKVSTVIACQGLVDGEDWVFLVHVIDDEGTILVTQY